MDTLKIWVTMSMEMTGRAVLMGGTRALRDSSRPMGVGMVAKIGDRSVLVIPTVMGVVLQVMIVEVEGVMITGTKNAIGGHPQLSQPLVTRRVKKVRAKTPGTLRSTHIQMHQGMSQRQEMTMFPWRKAFLRHCGLSAQSGSRFVMKRMNGGGSDSCGVNNDSKLTTRHC
jgi:hypothetical protein